MMSNLHSFSLLKDSFYYGLAKFCSFIVVVSAVPLYTNFLSPEDFYIIDLSLILQGFILSIVSLEVLQASGRYLSTPDLGFSVPLVNSTSLFFFVFSVVLGVFLISVFGFFILYDDLPEVFLFVFCFAFFFNAFYYFSLNSLRWQHRSKEYFFVCFFYMVCNVLGFLGVVFLEQASLVNFLLINGFSSLLASFIGFSVLLRFGSFKLDFDMGLLVKLLKYSVPLVFTTICFWLINYIDRFFLLTFHDAEASAVYAASHRVAMISIFFVSVFQMAWLPIFFKHSSDKIFSAVVFDFFVVYVYLGLCFCFFLYFVAVFFVGDSFEGVYFDAAYLVIPITVSLILMNSHVFFVGAFLDKKTHFFAAVVFLSLIVKVFFGFFMTEVFSYQGAVVSSVIAAIFYFFFNYRISNRFYHVLASFEVVFWVFLMFCIACFSFYFWGVSMLFCLFAYGCISGFLCRKSFFKIYRFFVSGV